MISDREKQISIWKLWKTLHSKNLKIIMGDYNYDVIKCWLQFWRKIYFDFIGNILVVKFCMVDSDVEL
jgi:hypothetical protein